MVSPKTDKSTVADPMTFMELLWPGPLIVQGICTAARLRIADLLANGPKSIGALAESASARPKALKRLLTALTSVGVFSVDEIGNWQNTVLSEFLREDHPHSMRSWALIMGSPFFWRPMGELEHSIVTGKEAFTKVFQADFFDYLKSNPDDGTLFNQAMAAQSSEFMDEITEAFDFSRFGTLADLGGGTGKVLATILRDNPQLKGTLYELPDVIGAVEESLVAEFGGRLKLESGSFFDSVPEGIDCYMVVRVIHDWPDDEAVMILRNCRRAMGPDSTLLLVEGVLDENAPPNYAMMDMLMLVLAGSMERTENDFRTLLESGGFELGKVIRYGRITILECSPI